ncbi:ribonuclease HII [Vararia minispora EC-137]|uniref:Ribonuclease HII n=1 Tax=Vararia minispora EC-137 TaxID=1314806 RepID=A0ACB8QE89_9AGAM|nr:ribonuclease HII [Vararia minispora EC-137]
MLGVDEAGRGPVLGPMIYGIAYCPVAYKDQLEELGFADSKTLTHEARSSLLKILSSDLGKLGWSDISSGMLHRPPVNLNKQAQDATVLLIREVLRRGLEVTEVFVDALGPTKPYQTYLTSQFPGINFTVAAKADDKFKIVGAASVAAKVTRDAWIEGWLFEEDDREDASRWSSQFGSGYPSDPTTKAWIQSSLDRTFGYPSFVRFSWTTVKVILEKDAHKVKWPVSHAPLYQYPTNASRRIDDGQASLVKSFESGSGADKDRCLVARDLGLSTICTL